MSTVTTTPISGTHTVNEFEGTNGITVTFVDSPTHVFEIKLDDNTPGEVKCIAPYIDGFPDMEINISTKSFTFSSLFAFAVKRKTYFLSQGYPVEVAKEYRVVDSPHLLPDYYTAVYRMDPPNSAGEEIVFTITGRERVQPIGTTDPGTNYEWYPKTYEWKMSAIAATDGKVTAAAIRAVVRGGAGYQKSVIAYPEAAVDSIEFNGKPMDELLVPSTPYPPPLSFVTYWSVANHTMALNAPGNWVVHHTPKRMGNSAPWKNVLTFTSPECPGTTSVVTLYCDGVNNPVMEVDGELRNSDGYRVLTWKLEDFIIDSSRVSLLAVVEDHYPFTLVHQAVAMWVPK